MSVLGGFQMLNDTIRGMREDKRRHAERMDAIRLEKQKLDYEINDPRAKLERQKAADQMQTGRFELGSIGQFGNDPDKKAFYNAYTKPAITDILDDEGYELGEKGQVFYKGTQNPVELPKWKRESLESAIKLAAYGSRVAHDEYDLRLHKYNTRIKSMEDEIAKDGKGKEKIVAVRLGQLYAERDDLLKEYNDPTHKMKRLAAANERLTKLNENALQDPDIPDSFFTKMMAMQKQNNDNIESLLKDGANSKHWARVSYWRRRDGLLEKKHRYVPKNEVDNLASSYKFDKGADFTLGEVTVDPGNRGGGDDLRDIDLVNKEYTNWKLALSLAESEIKDENVIMDRLKGRMSEEKAAEVAQFIRSNATEAAKEYRHQIAAIKFRHGKRKGFRDNVKVDEEGNLLGEDKFSGLFKDI